MPGKRLTLMIQILLRPAHLGLERSMRIWAFADEAVLASVQRSDSRVLRAVRQAFVDYGLSDDEARPALGGVVRDRRRPPVWGRFARCI